MKVINKILCFLSVLVLCVPLFCFNVSAEGNPLNDFNSSFDITNYEVYSSSSSKYKNPSYVNYRYYPTYKDYFIPFDDFVNNPFLAFIYFDYSFLNSENYYYILFTSGSTADDYRWLCYASASPITLTSGSDGYVYFTSDTDFSSSEFCINSNYSFYNLYYNKSSVGTSSYLNYPNLKFSSSCTTLKDTYYSVNPKSGTSFETRVWDNIYSNCDIIDKSILPNLTENKILEIGETFTLSDYIDVKLTPEFGLDMDRVFDKNTGQNDYFKLEVTNNSDTNIQFYCAIVDPGVKTLYNDNGQVSEFAFNHSYWNYIHDSEYYQLDAKTESRYLGFASTTTLYANKLAGNIFWIILKPDEHFEDYIYWENVKIMPTTSYDFLCEACPTENDIATDMFVTSNEQLEKQFYLSGGSKAHFWSISESLEVDQSVEQYALHSEDVCEIYRVNFSVLSIPEFSSTVRGGNSKITSGWSDTQKQASNPYYKQNLMTGQIEGIENYKEFKGNLSDVNVNLDDVGIDDVKSYISYSQSFFGLLKSVFQCFPALWIIIVFGLTAIVVIAIVRYIRG